MEILCLAVKKVAKNKDLCLLSKVLYHLLFIEKPLRELFCDFSLPQAKENIEDSLEFDLFSVFPILAHIPYSYEKLAQRGVDEKVNRDTHRQLDICICEDSEKKGRPFFSTDYFLSYRAFIYSKTLRVERLRFELASSYDCNAYVFINEIGDIKIMMHDVMLHKSGNVLNNLGCEQEQGSYYASVKQTEEYFEGYLVDENSYLAQNKLTKLYKNQWKILFQPKDTVLGVHIPFSGSFDKESCEKSYEKARILFRKCFPEYQIKGFFTKTWFLAPALKDVIKVGSNIYNFRQNFHIFPSKNNALSVFEYVYKLPIKSINDIDFDSLEENTSLQKGIKEQLKNGKYIYEFRGFIKF